MARLGPWDAGRRVAVAVSGGADSLALAVLAQGWGDPVAFIVDHGLRPAAMLEAESARVALAARGLTATVLSLVDLKPGPGLAARARIARYAALTAACRQAGLVDLLLGHHAGDQAETVLMRQRRGSGPAGLAGMAAMTETRDLRMLRPLLTATPGQLRAVVHDAGLQAVEDPTNTDERTSRARLRREIGEDRAALLAVSRQAGIDRAEAEAATAATLAARASIYPEGYAVLSPGPVAPASLAALVRTVAGRRYPVDAGALAATPRAATLAGVRMQPAGRAGTGWLLTREEQAMARPSLVEAGALWDGRFVLVGGSPGAAIGALGNDAGGVRHRSALPSAVLRALPALRCNGILTAVPHLDSDCRQASQGDVKVYSAALPAAGAPFLAC